MRVAILRIEFHLPHARSLKDKRRPLRSLIERLRHRFHCSVAEIDFQNLHQRAAIGLALVSPEGKQLARMLASVTAYLRNDRELLVTTVRRQELNGTPEVLFEVEVG